MDMVEAMRHESHKAVLKSFPIWEREHYVRKLHEAANAASAAVNLLLTTSRLPQGIRRLAALVPVAKGVESEAWAEYRMVRDLVKQIENEETGVRVEQERGTRVLLGGGVDVVGEVDTIGIGGLSGGDGGSSPARSCG